MLTSSRKYGLFDFPSYIADRVANFTGRTWVFQEIDHWLGLEGASRYFLLTGEPGCGKSAVAARLVQFSSGEVAPPSGCQRLAPGLLRAVHFCRATASDWIDPRNFARSIALQFASIPEYAHALKDVGDKEINIDVQIQAGTVEAGSSVTGLAIQNLIVQGLSGQDAFNRIVLDPLRTIYDNGYKRPIFILVDSLDEALTSSTDVKIVDLLAGVQGLDSRVRFILTSRPEPRVQNRFPFADGLSLSDPAHAADNNRDIADFVTLRLQQDPLLASKVAELSPAQAAALPAGISASADGNFQYVAFLLNAAARGQQSLDDPAGLPSGLDLLYNESLTRVVTLGKKDWDAVYKPFLGVLSVAQEPMTLELLKFYTASATGLWSVYTDLLQFVETASAKPLIGEEVHAEEHYRLYHQSIIDFLHKRQLAVSVNGQKKTLPNVYYVDAEDWHARIVASCEGAAGNWSQVDWSTAAPYTLRHLIAHLNRLRRIDDYRNKLHALLETRAFIGQHLARLGKPYLVLDDLRLALNLALEQDDLAQAWRHIREFRRVTRDQLDFEQLRTAVETGNKTGDYSHIMERTALYSYMPNSQALARLWIAWNAAASGHTTEATAIVKRTLDRLPPRGVAQITSRQAGSRTTEAVDDAIGETLQRLLVRIAQAVETETGPQRDWLHEALSPWPANAVDATVTRLPEPLTSWGEMMDAGQMNETMESLFVELQARGGRLDADVTSSLDRDTIYFFQRRLAAGLFNNRHDPKWMENVRRTVALISLDDYPSYREMALSWVAASVLAEEDPVLAREAFATVLGGMFRPSPGFWGDTVAAAISGMDRENSQGSNSQYLLDVLEHVEATGDHGVDPTIPRKLPFIIEWRRKVGLPEDPWSFSMRRRNAVAAVLHRQGELAGAEALLQDASAELHEGSYAGFRALARLSLACRWLEWRRILNAIDQTSLAETDASHVRDEVLRRERLDLVSKMRSWITASGLNSAVRGEEEALAQLQQTTGLERGLFIEFLSALWFDTSARLKRLLPLTLDDATTADAVLGRLLGVQALQAGQGRPFLQLVKALQIDTGLENE